MLKHVVYASILTSCLLGAGCSSNSQTPPDPEVPQPGRAAPESGAPDPQPAPEGQSEDLEPVSESPPAEPVTLQTMTWDEAYALVGGQNGKVVVMDLWSTSCPPCIRELPSFVELANEYPDDVSCISVAMDYAGFEDEPVESYRESVLKVLTKFNAQTRNVLCSTDFNSVLGPIVPHRSLPAVYVYDQTGELVGQFPDPADPAEFTYEADIVPLVAKLIGK